MSDVEQRKNRIIALFLSLGFGFFGLDRFYLGKPVSGIFKLLTFGGFGLWWAIDNMLLMLDAMLYSFGKDVGIVKDGRGRHLQYGLSMYPRNNGQFEKDWFK